MTKTAILIIADENQFPPAFFLASRLVFLRGDRDVDIVLASNYPAGLAQAKEIGAPIRLLNIERLHAGLDLPVVYYFTRATYFSLFVPPLLRGDYSRILYLDVDTYPESDKVFALFDLATDGQPIAAVRDLQVPFIPTPSNGAELHAALGIEAPAFLGAKYLNSGVLLIDTAEFVRAKIEKHAVRIIREKRIELRMPDQTIFNALLKGRWTELSPAFNMVTRAWASFVRRFVPPVIVHFTGPVKPWHRLFVDDHRSRHEIAAFLQDSPWSTFIADVNPTPSFIGSGPLPPPAAPQTPLWEGYFLAALVRYLRDTPFADVTQGITRTDPSALPAER